MPAAPKTSAAAIVGHARKSTSITYGVYRQSGPPLSVTEPWMRRLSYPGW
jgi:hypothetical protein